MGVSRVLAAVLLASTLRGGHPLTHVSKVTRTTARFVRNTTCLDPNANTTLRGMHLNVTAIEFWPHSYENDDGSWGGVYFDIWNRIAELEVGFFKPRNEN